MAVAGVWPAFANGWMAIEELVLCGLSGVRMVAKSSSEVVQPTGSTKLSGAPAAMTIGLSGSLAGERVELGVQAISTRRSRGSMTILVPIEVPGYG